MDNHDESLEVGIAAGLDVPTALVISEREDGPRKGCGCAAVVVLAVVLAVAAAVVWGLLRAV